MKWVSLHLNMLPIIAIETDQRIQEFQSLTEKVIIEGQTSDIQQLNNLRASIKKRIHQLDVFYERHHQDQTIPLFHMLRMKLQRVIFKKQHIANETMQLSLEKDKDSLLVEPTAKYNFGEHLSFSDYQPLFHKQSQTSSKQVRYDNPISHKQFPIKSKSPSKPQPQKKVQEKQKKPQKPQKPIEKKTNLKPNLATSHKKPTTKSSQNLQPPKKKPEPKQKKQPQPIKQVKSMKPLGQNIIIKEEQEDSEFRFTIKMTKQQYQNLLMLKHQMFNKK